MRAFMMMLAVPALALALSSCASTVAEPDNTVHFAFGSAKLSTEAKHKLNEIGKRIRDSESVGDVIVVGYADPIGSENTNAKLSEQRAKVVRDYLQRISYRAISVGDTKWVGESRAETDCGATTNAKAIKCLQPERKVEVFIFDTYEYCTNNTSRKCSTN